MLSDGHIILRPYTGDDADAVYDAVMESRVELSRWMPWCHAGYGHEDSLQWVGSREGTWDRSEEYTFAVCDLGTGAYLGSIGLNRIDLPNRTANLGYWIRTSAARHGVATAAAGLCAAYGFAVLGLQRIEIIAAVENVASLRVAEKAGAVREAVLRRRIVVNGVTHDAVLFALLRPDDPEY